MHSATRRGAACVVAGALFTAACGSSGAPKSAPHPTSTGVTAAAVIPAAQAFAVYTPSKVGFSLRYPKGWKQEIVQRAMTFSHGYNEIAVATAKRGAPTSVAEVRAQDVDALRPRLGFKLVRVDVVARPAGRAVRIVYQATSVPDQVTGRRVLLDVQKYLFWHRGRLLVLTLSTPHGTHNAAAWRTVTDSLAWR
jgi:hypothetical protein